MSVNVFKDPNEELLVSQGIKGEKLQVNPGLCVRIY